MKKRNVSYDDVTKRISQTFNLEKEGQTIAIYPVVRGGVPIALMLEKNYKCYITKDPTKADVIIDDIIDSGKTRDKFKEMYEIPFYAPYENEDEWIVFPWEESKEKDNEDIITRMLEAIGENPNREGLKETPARVVKSWKELFAGYDQDPKEILSKSFNTKSDEMVICKDIEFYSMCEHHLLPFIGKAHVAYIPNDKVVGLSKLARVVDVFARRLQIQEGLTRQIAEAILDNTDCKGVGVVVEAKHHCMCSRGVGKQSSSMVTSCLLENFREPQIRAEFLNLIGK